jgi:5-methylcytosine-specific restriction protein B
VELEFIKQLVEAVGRVNAKIEQAHGLGADFLIGHSYYSEGPQEAETAQAWYARVLEDEIGPQLEEYWIEAPAQATAARQLMSLKSATVVDVADE